MCPPQGDASKETRYPAGEGASDEHSASGAGSVWMVEFPVVLTLDVWKRRVTNFVMFLKLFPSFAILTTKQIF